MNSIYAMDELVKEYLYFRGFNLTLAKLEEESMSDYGFQSDKLCTIFKDAIENCDINEVIEHWSKIKKLVSSESASKLGDVLKETESDLYKWTIASCIKNSREKAPSVLQRIAHLSSEIDWRTWFSILYCTRPEEDELFAPYFQDKWAEVFLLSLANLIELIFQSVPLPRLLCREKERLQLSAYKCEIESLKVSVETLNAEIESKGKDKELDDLPLFSMLSSKRMFFKEKFQASGPVSFVSFSAHGKYLAAILSNSINVFDESGQAEQIYIKGSIEGFSWEAKNEKYFYMGVSRLDGRFIEKHSLEKKNTLQYIQLPFDVSKILQLKVSPSNQQIIATIETMQGIGLLSWNLINPDKPLVIRELSPKRDNIFASFNHNGQLIQVVCGKTISIFDSKLSDPLHRITLESDCIMSEFNFDETLIYSFCMDKTLSFFSLNQSIENIQSIQIPIENASCLSCLLIFHGDFALISSDSHLFLFDIQNREIIDTLQLYIPLNNISWSENRCCIAICNNNEITIFKIQLQ